MADNSVLPATGETIASKDAAGVKHQKVLAEFDISGTPTMVSSTSPMPAAAPELTATNSLTSTTSCTLTLASQSQVAVQVTGTWGGTLQFEATVDGTNFFSVSAIVPTTGAVVTSTTANGVWLVPCAGYKQVRVRCSTFGSGTIVVSLQGSHGTQIVLTTGTVTEQGAVAHDGAAAGVAPVLLGGFASAAAPTNVSTDGDAVNGWFLPNGAQCQQLTAAGTLVGAGNGTAATALRVTVASDSTGIIGASCSGPLAHDAAAASSNPVLQGGYASAAAPTDVSADGDAVRAWHLRNGARCVNLTAAGVLIASGNGTASTAIRVTVASDSTGTIACTSATAANFNVRADHTLVDNAAFTDGTSRVGLIGCIFDETAGTALTENDVAAPRIDAKRAIVNVIEDATTRGQRLAVSSAGAAKVEGGAAHDAAVAGAPMLAGLEARTASGTAVQQGDAVRAQGDIFGKQVVLVGGLYEERVKGYANYTTNTAADLIAAQGAGVKMAITTIIVTNKHATVGTDVTIRCKTTTANAFGPHFAAANGGGFALSVASGALLLSTANEIIEAICGTTGANVDVTIIGHLVKN